MTGSGTASIVHHTAMRIARPPTIRASSLTVVVPSSSQVRSPSATPRRRKNQIFAGGLAFLVFTCPVSAAGGVVCVAGVIVASRCASSSTPAVAVCTILDGCRGHVAFWSYRTRGGALSVRRGALTRVMNAESVDEATTRKEERTGCRR